MLPVFSRRRIVQALGIGASCPAILRAAKPDPWARAAEIVKRLSPPNISDRRFVITDFGARPGALTNCGPAISAAIAACVKAGGGKVVVPAGGFLTGAIRLRSNVELHLERNAILKFSTSPSDYPLVHTRWEGWELINYSPLIYAYREQNIAITGQGTIDGQADALHWWPWKGPWGGTIDHGWRNGLADQRPARRRLEAMAEQGVPVEQRVFGDNWLLRPPTIGPYDCENVLIEGVRIRRSPFWQVHPILCRNVIIRDLDIMSHGPNNDGCDPESCRDVLIENCLFDTGDDCIAINSGRNADGRRFAVPSESIVIRNCRMKEGHGGLTIGSGISGGARDIFAERCRLDSPDLDYAIRFKNNALRGGLVENVYFRDIQVGSVAKAAITCDFNYEEGANGQFKPILRNAVIERLNVRDCPMVIDAQGLPQAPVGPITIRDSSFFGVKKPSVFRHVIGTRLERLKVNGRRAARL